GIALLPARMFAHELQQGRLARPFETEIATGRYWLTRLKSRPVTAAMQAFSGWLVQAR
ncbi:MAG: LysR substrate-binding domain-containing protein, partial [Comamonas sp.]